MKKVVFFLLMAAYLLPALPVSAHTLSHDGQIGAIMHISPEDDPQAGSPIIFHLEFKDRSGKFEPNDCSCTLQIVRNKAVADSFDLLKGAKVQGLSVDSQIYRFKEKGSYEVKVVGQPKLGASFEPFTLAYPVNVTREYLNLQNIIPHTPAQLRHIANIAHWGVGWPALLAMIIGILHAKGKIKGSWPLWSKSLGLLIGGLFIVLWSLLHHGLGKLPQTWTIIRVDHQSLHHVYMGLILVVGGVTEAMRMTKRFKEQKWLSFVSPICIGAVGLLFLVHPQYGTEEALKHSKAFHFVLASVLIIGAGARVTQIAMRRAGKKEIYRKVTIQIWIICMLLTSLMLVTYHEPPGAYENFNPGDYQTTPAPSNGAN